MYIDHHITGQRAATVDLAYVITAFRQWLQS